MPRRARQLRTVAPPGSPPSAITHGSPKRSAAAPRATSVRSIPRLEAAANTTTSASGTPRWRCSNGIRYAGVLSSTVPAEAETENQSRLTAIAPVLTTSVCRGVPGVPGPAPSTRASHLQPRTTARPEPSRWDLGEGARTDLSSGERRFSASGCGGLDRNDLQLAPALPS